MNPVGSMFEWGQRWSRSPVTNGLGSAAGGHCGYQGAAALASRRFTSDGFTRGLVRRRALAMSMKRAGREAIGVLMVPPSKSGMTRISQA